MVVIKASYYVTILDCKTIQENTMKYEQRPVVDHMGVALLVTKPKIPYYIESLNGRAYWCVNYVNCINLLLQILI